MIYEYIWEHRQDGCQKNKTRCEKNIREMMEQAVKEKS